MTNDDDRVAVDREDLLTFCLPTALRSFPTIDVFLRLRCCRRPGLRRSDCAEHRQATEGEFEGTPGWFGRPDRTWRCHGVDADDLDPETPPLHLTARGARGGTEYSEKMTRQPRVATRRLARTIMAIRHVWNEGVEAGISMLDT
jgi:hypothetical protein